MNKTFKVALGWEDSSLLGHVVSGKKLRYEGLYTFLGMVRYCMKDNGRVIVGLSSTIVSISYGQEWAVVPQFYLVIPLRSTRMDVMRVVFIWRIRMDVHNKKMEEISTIFGHY